MIYYKMYFYNICRIGGGKMKLKFANIKQFKPFLQYLMGVASSLFQTHHIYIRLVHPFYRFVNSPLYCI